jgi:hypothetical protein
MSKPPAATLLMWFKRNEGGFNWPSGLGRGKFFCLRLPRGKLFNELHAFGFFAKMVQYECLQQEKTFTQGFLRKTHSV